MTVLLMNPNSNRNTTDIMCRIAGRVLGADPVGWTATQAPPMIVQPAALDTAARCVAAADIPTGIKCAIVAAFGDPGAMALSRTAPCPVIGIGAASARAASVMGAKFAVATTTPALRDRIDSLMTRNSGSGQYIGCFLSKGEPIGLMDSEAALDDALLQAITRAVAAGAQRVIIGGGPLGAAADRLAGVSPVPLVNPVLAAAAEVHKVLTLHRPSSDRRDQQAI